MLARRESIRIDPYETGTWMNMDPQDKNEKALFIRCIRVRSCRPVGAGDSVLIRGPWARAHGYNMSSLRDSNAGAERMDPKRGHVSETQRGGMRSLRD